MIKSNWPIKTTDVNNKLKRFWELSAEKIHLIKKNYDASSGSPVFTVKGTTIPREVGRNGPRVFNTDLLFYNMMLPEKNRCWKQVGEILFNQWRHMSAILVYTITDSIM